MEDRTDSPMAVKVEKHSQCVILTYFHGDINSMVDAHFSRALSKVCKAKVPAAKTNKLRKTIKLGKHTKSTVYDLPDYREDNRSQSSSLHGFFLCPPQRTAAPVRAALSSPTQSHRSLL